MAYLKKLKRLLPAKKVLRLLATKLRLHKLQKPKTTRRRIKKHHPTTITTTSSGWLSLSFQSRFKRKRKDLHVLQRYPRKKTKPVYVDQLFLEQKQPENIPVVERVGGEIAVVEGTTSGKGGGGVADDLWESVVMGTAQMDGINERAEEFISRFRADLLVQEITARRL